MMTLAVQLRCIAICLPVRLLMAFHVVRVRPVSISGRWKSPLLRCYQRFRPRRRARCLSDFLFLAARRHELLIRPIGNTVYLMPPYLIDTPTAQWLAQAVRATLDEVLAGA